MGKVYIKQRGTLVGHLKHLLTDMTMRRPHWKKAPQESTRTFKSFLPVPRASEASSSSFIQFPYCKDILTTKGWKHNQIRFRWRVPSWLATAWQHRSALLLFDRLFGFILSPPVSSMEGAKAAWTCVKHLQCTEALGFACLQKSRNNLKKYADLSISFWQKFRQSDSLTGIRHKQAVPRNKIHHIGHGGKKEEGSSLFEDVIESQSTWCRRVCVCHQVLWLQVQLLIRRIAIQQIVKTEGQKEGRSNRCSSAKFRNAEEPLEPLV